MSIFLKFGQFWLIDNTHRLGSNYHIVKEKKKHCRGYTLFHRLTRVQPTVLIVYQVVWPWSKGISLYTAYKVFILSDAITLISDLDPLIMVVSCSPDDNQLYQIVWSRSMQYGFYPALKVFLYLTMLWHWPWKKKTGFHLSWWWLSIQSRMTLKQRIRSLSCFSTKWCYHLDLWPWKTIEFFLSWGWSSAPSCMMLKY
jgi:hypothetical protein